jgi:anti-sigma regulatory factor (Ser/Thr protein kinase)
MRGGPACWWGRVGRPARPRSQHPAILAWLVDGGRRRETSLWQPHHKEGTVARHQRQTAPDTPRRLDASVRATRTAARQARRALQRLALPRPLGDHAELLVSELVTNSVRHAGLGPADLIQVTADWSGERLKVAVRDGRGALPAVVAGAIRPAPGAESGWGLYLVDRLASRWGTAAGGYWFELRPEQPAQGR